MGTVLRRWVGGAVAVGLASTAPAVAHEGELEPWVPAEPSTLGGAPPEEVGALSPLIPWHKDAIHQSVVWPRSKPPQVCFWMRPSEWRGTDLVDILNPGTPPLGTLRQDFKTLVYGDFNFSATLEESVRSPILSDVALENTLCADIPAAFVNTGKHRIEDLTPADVAANASAFHDAGHSRGLNYNLFCAGNVMDAQGRIAVIGGHDKAGNHGLRKINLYDPETGRWVARPVPLTLSSFLSDPTGAAFPDPKMVARDEQNTDPVDAADMKYQRWYPSGVALPDGRILALSGTDQDSTDPATAAGSKKRMTAPEVWDPQTETTQVLYDARKLQNMYVRSFVVQTGFGMNDWKVLTVGEAVPPFPVTPRDLRGYDPWEYAGNTYLLDVLGALKAGKHADVVCEANCQHDCPAQCQNHWEYLGTAGSAHDSGAAVRLAYLDHRGLPMKQKIIAFGGSGQEGETALVESLELTLGPRGVETTGWKEEASLPFPMDQNNAVLTPTGEVVIFGGTGRREGVRTNNMEVQLFKPETGELQTVAMENVPRHDHSTGTLMPNGAVLISGGNRVELTANPDDAIPVSRLYYPPYLFHGALPRILEAPEQVHYGAKLRLKVNRKLTQVALLRIGPTTHNWSWGNTYVRLAFTQKGDEVKVVAPAVPGAAVPGVYMLYVVDDHGIPSEASRVLLTLPKDANGG